MSRPRAVAVLGLVLALAACGQRGGATGSPAPTGGTPSPTATLPADGLVLRVALTGGFVPPSVAVGRLPLVSVYRDGRVVTEGPTPAVFPGPASPNVQLAQVSGGEVQRLADAALAAGVAGTQDLGTPGITDLPSTTFTLVTAEQTWVRDVRALREGVGDPALDDTQVAAREALTDLLDELTATPGTEAYRPTAVAAVAEPWVDPGDGLDPAPEVAWPGPDLPGEPTGPALGCVLVTGDALTALTDALAGADARTPWTSAGARWSVVLRPLLPDETGCADLSG